MQILNVRNDCARQENYWEFRFLTISSLGIKNEASVWQRNQSGMKFKDKKTRTKKAEQKCSAFFIHRKGR